MKIRSFGFAFLALVAGAAPLRSEPVAPTVYNVYDGLPPGGRPTAMGLAFCAVGNDPSAICFNPAGLTGVTRNTFSLSYEATRQSTLSAEEIFRGDMLRNNRFIFLSMCTPQASFSWRPLSNASFRTVNGTDYEDDEIKVNAYTVSASQKTKNGLTSGLNLSYLSGQIAQSRTVNGAPFVNLSDGYGFSMDIGFMYTVAPELEVGVNFQNLAGFMWWEDFEKDLLPFILRAGAAFKVTDFMIFATDWEKRYYRGADPVSLTHFGLEQRLGSVLALRGGIYGTDLDNNNTTHITAGLGYLSNGYDLSLAGEKYKVSGTDVYRYLFTLNLPL